MSWFGKLLGGAVGFALGGPIGALIGVALGHNLDRGAGGGERLDRRERTQTAFFTAAFAVMGHLAKSDGRVTRDEIRIAGRIMDELGLSPAQRRLAQQLFTQGKAPDFPLDDVLEQFRRECRGSRQLVAMFVEILVHAAYADGDVAPGERSVLEHCCRRLGVAPEALAHVEAMVRAQAQFAGAGDGAPTKASLDDAYAVLGVGPERSDAEIKRAYRRLMSQHHPDKLVSKGLPEEMVRVATERTQEIKAAYERVREARGM